MTREKALSHVAPNLSYFNDCKPAFATKEYKKWVNKIYDDFEKEKTCDGCIHKPKANENYPEECGLCSRFYTDEFKEKKDEN